LHTSTFELLCSLQAQKIATKAANPRYGGLTLGPIAGHHQRLHAMRNKG